jgi:hypothetical protein
MRRVEGYTVLTLNVMGEAKKSLGMGRVHYYTTIDFNMADFTLFR